jgi:hypothetical protein
MTLGLRVGAEGVLDHARTQYLKGLSVPSVSHGVKQDGNEADIADVTSSAGCEGPEGPPIRSDRAFGFSLLVGR